MSARKSVLVVGVTHASAGAPQHIKQDGSDPVELREKVKRMMGEAEKAGFDLEIRQLDPEALSTRTEEIVKLLQERPWDGYVVGFGLRGDPSLTTHFEDLVNAGRMLRPETKMGFNTNPLDLVSTIDRMFGKV